MLLGEFFTRHFFSAFIIYILYQQSVMWKVFLQQIGNYHLTLQVPSALRSIFIYFSSLFLFDTQLCSFFFSFLKKLYQLYQKGGDTDNRGWGREKCVWHATKVIQPPELWHCDHSIWYSFLLLGHYVTPTQPFWFTLTTLVSIVSTLSRELFSAIKLW